MGRLERGDAGHRIDPIAFLVNPNNAVAELDTSDAQAAAAALGQRLIVVKAASEGDIDTAFATVAQQQGGGLLQQLDPFLQSRRDQLVALAARYRLLAIYERRDFATAGGLISYGTSLSDALHLVGSYAGRPAGAAAGEVRAGDQSQDRQGAWSRHAADGARARRRGDRVAVLFAAMR